MPPSSILDVAFDVAEGHVRFELCCEPAAGQTWQLQPEGPPRILSIGALEHRSATGAGVRGDRAVGWLKVTPPGGDPYRVEADPRFALDNAVAPDGGTAVAIDEGGNPESWRVLAWSIDEPISHLRQATVVWQSDGGQEPTAPAIDADGRVWIGLRDVGTGRVDHGVVVGLGSGEVVERITYRRPLSDQSFDATGRYLLMAHEDGTVAYRRIDGPTRVLRDLEFKVVDW